MEEFVNLIDQFGSPYSDLLWVSILFVITALFSYLITVLTERKEVDVEEEAVVPEEIEESPAEEPEIQQRKHEAEFQADTGAPETSGITEQVSPEPVTAHEEPPEGELPDVFKTPVSGEGAERETEEQVTTAQAADTGYVDKPEEKVGDTEKDLFARLKSGLSKTHAGIFGKLDNILSRNEIDADLWDDFEESLITADLGVATTMKLRENLESEYSAKSLKDPSGIRDALKEEIRKILKGVEAGPVDLGNKPTVIMVAGANGVGKTTTIGKLANKYIKDGKKVMIAAGDTFRAAAVEQLEIWADRVGASFIKAAKGADPSSVAFDAVQSSVSKGIDLLIIDTAGRLHTKSNLMEELSKIKRVVGNKVEGAPHEVLLVLDATTGQNSIQQAKTFKDAIDVTGIILTKLDGTSRGGVIVAVADELQIPVRFIGIGEALDDLRVFNADEFVEALFLSGKETVH